MNTKNQPSMKIWFITRQDVAKRTSDSTGHAIWFESRDIVFDTLLNKTNNSFRTIVMAISMELENV